MKDQQLAVAQEPADAESTSDAADHFMEVVSDARRHHALCLICPWEGPEWSNHFDAVIDAAAHSDDKHPRLRSALLQSAFDAGAPS